MKNNTGLTVLDIINPNAGMFRWLNLLFGSGIIGKDTLAEAEVHFGLKRGKAAWLIFFKHIFGLLGVVLGICGLIFFMAWNWEDMNRLAKFATLEAAFVLFGGYSIWRWQGTDGSVRWDARIALFGAALLVGGMLALYGQIYQTGADPWELFRAWTIMLAVLALPGRVTAFWFMVWLAGSLWLGLYLGIRLNIMRLDINGHILILYMALAQFAMLAVNEIAAKMLEKADIPYDHGRWLRRIIGSTAIIFMACFAFSRLTVFGYEHTWMSAFGFIYLISLGLTFFVYYQLIPELLFLALSIFSLAAFIAVKFAESLFRSSNYDLDSFLVLGLLVLALTFGALKIVLVLSKGIKARAQKSRTDEITRRRAHSLGGFKNREEKKAELKNWLIGHGAASAEDIEICYAELEKDQDLESPWYVKVFVSIGVWIGSAVALGAFTLLVFAGLKDPSTLGILGILLCGASIQLGRPKKLAMRAFGQILGVCGLIYAALLFDYNATPTLMLLAALFAMFWLLKPPFAGRLGAFLGSLTCLFLFLGALWGAPSYYYSAPFFGAGWYVKTALYCLGLLASVHYLVVMDGRAPISRRKPENSWLEERFNLAEVLDSAVYACLIFFAAMTILIQIIPRDLYLIGMDASLGTAAVFAALTGLMGWRYPAARLPALGLGSLLTVLGWFAPHLSMGFGLTLLAFHTGRNAFLGAAVAYLGCATWVYYYNLELSLLYKSLTLIGSGLVFLILAFALSRLTGKEALQ